MRSQMFAKALPMIQTIGSLKRLELLRNHPELKQTLGERKCIAKWIAFQTSILGILIHALRLFILRVVYRKQ
jgi:hypothetical protein